MAGPDLEMIMEKEKEPEIYCKVARMDVGIGWCEKTQNDKLCSECGRNKKRKVSLWREKKQGSGETPH
jgi:hypothetical protein